MLTSLPRMTSVITEYDCVTCGIFITLTSVCVDHLLKPCIIAVLCQLALVQLQRLLLSLVSVVATYNVVPLV